MHFLAVVAAEREISLKGIDEDAALGVEASSSVRETRRLTSATDVDE
jgi:hypothetical protein